MKPPKPSSDRVCGAKTRDGDPCKNWGMANGRCRMHGGASLVGIASPAYRHGYYSAYMPIRSLVRAAMQKEALRARADAIVAAESEAREAKRAAKAAKNTAFLASLTEADFAALFAVTDDDGASDGFVDWFMVNVPEPARRGQS